jgi:hypothetical protein
MESPAPAPSLPAIAARREAKGIQMTEHGPMLLVAAPVLDGAGCTRRPLRAPGAGRHHDHPDA